jgi:hypothetical protein
VALRHTRTSARERGDPRFAHLGSGVPAKWSRTSRDDDGRRRTGSFGGNGRGGFAPGSWLHGAARRGPAKLGRRSARPGGQRWPAISRWRAYRRRRLGLKADEHRKGNREHGSGVGPDARAELPRRSQAAGLQRIGVLTAAELCPERRQGGGGVLRVCGGGAGGNGSKGRRRG